MFKMFKTIQKSRIFKVLSDIGVCSKLFLTKNLYTKCFTLFTNYTFRSIIATKIQAQFWLLFILTATEAERLERSENIG